MHCIHEIQPTDGPPHANLRSRLAILRLACRFSPFSPPPFFLGRGASTSGVESENEANKSGLAPRTNTENLVEPLRIREPDQEATRSDQWSGSDENVLEIQERDEAEENTAYSQKLDEVCCIRRGDGVGRHGFLKIGEQPGGFRDTATSEAGFR